ncbi:MAG: 2-5 ligase [Cyanobacteria bacterium RYN_339]|nr:2-5 ligase [Cyanobacteria bacterium RYN_339]
MRLFTAIEVPETVHAEVARTQAALRAEGHRARWTRPSQAHITVHFLGEQADQVLPEIQASLAAACRGLAPVALTVRDLGSFRGGVLWLGVAGDLGSLERVCREALGLEGGPYHPHVTLARAFHGQLPALAPSGHDFTASVLTLFRSELKLDGAVHHVVARFPLGQPF